MMHCATLGAGPDVVLVHGWAWHGGVWQTVAETLAHEFRVWIPDLPGHGRSHDVAATSTLTDWSRALDEIVPAQASWIGWSLGAMLALAAAQAGRARKLILISPTPRFVQTDGWPHAVSPSWLENFSADFAAAPQRALERFASLHLAGVGNERALLRHLRTLLAENEAPAQMSASGLALLRDTDLRATPANLRVPSLIVHGARDRVIPPAAGEWLAQHLPQARWLGIDDAGHAPFLSHHDVVVERVRTFLHE